MSRIQSCLVVPSRMLGGLNMLCGKRKRTRTEQITFNSGPFVAEMGNAIHVHNRLSPLNGYMIAR